MLCVEISDFKVTKPLPVKLCNIKPPVDSFTCMCCPFVSQWPEARREHMDIHIKEIWGFPCSYCPLILNTNLYRIYHHWTHTGKKPYECNVCKQLFLEKENLDIHVNEHLKQKPFPYDILTSDWRTYKLDHLGKRIFQCEVCGNNFKSRGGTKLHMKIHLDTLPAKHLDKNCKKTFKSKYRLLAHARHHTDKKQCKCKICGMIFTNSHCLRNHQSVHTRNLPYQCDVCKRSYLTAASRSSHYTTKLHLNNLKAKMQTCATKF